MPVYIDDMKTRLDATEALLIAQLATRTVTRTLKNFRDQDETELASGIVTLVSAGELDYRNQKGAVARDGTQSMLVIGHLRVAETATGADVETLELAMIEELKAALRVGVAGIGYSLISVNHSRQLEVPYGWFVADIKAGPERSSVRTT